MKFRLCQAETGHRIEVRIRRDRARADVRPLGDAEEHWFFEDRSPIEVLTMAQKEADSRQIPLCVTLDDDVDWNAEWDEALVTARATPHTAAPHG